MAEPVRLCIVGSQLAAWRQPEADELRVRQVIRVAIQILVPDTVISGRSPGGGVDRWAEEEAALLGYFPGTTEEAGFWPYPATAHRWEGEGGFRQRNKAMAEVCTHLLAIRSMWSTTYGSGWTADHARRLGRIVTTLEF